MIELLTIPELATTLQLSQQTIRNLLSTCPERLPRARRLSGAKAVYFRLEDVRLHLQQQIVSTEAKNSKKNGSQK